MIALKSFFVGWGWRSEMIKIIKKIIKFEYCYYFVFFELACRLVKPRLLKMFPSDSIVFFSAKVLAVIFSLYVLLGFIKISYLFKKKNFRLLIIIIAVLSLYHSRFFPVSNPEKNILFYLQWTHSLIILFLYHIAFKSFLIKGKDFMEKLSKYYLYVLILSVIMIFSIWVSQYFKPIIIFGLVVFPTFVLSILILITKMKLFKYLQLKYEK